VYFATYEVVKQQLGGNVGYGHHPIATGSTVKKSLANYSQCRNVCCHRKRGVHESIRWYHPLSIVLMVVIKQRMQIHGSPFRSVFKCASSVFHTEGLRAFYISYPTTLMMSVPFNVSLSSTILTIGHSIRDIRLNVQNPQSST